MLSDPTLVVAQLRLPITLGFLGETVAALSKLYDDRSLVIVTSGPLVRDGWMVIARRTPVDVDGSQPQSSAKGGAAASE